MSVSLDTGKPYYEVDRRYMEKNSRKFIAQLFREQGGPLIINQGLTSVLNLAI